MERIGNFPRFYEMKTTTDPNEEAVVEQQGPVGDIDNSPPPISISFLPDELLGYISDYLPEDRNKWKEVCKAFYSIVRSNPHSTVCIDLSKLTEENAEAFASYFENIRKGNLSVQFDSRNTDFNTTSKWFELFCDKVAKNEEVNTLHLELLYGLGENYIRRLGDQLADKIKLLTIDRAWNLSDESVKSLAALTQLNTLNIICNWLSAQGVEKLATLTSLEKLDLSLNNIDDEGVKAVAAGLTRLTALNIYGNGIGPDGLAALTTLTELRSLNIGSNPTIQMPHVLDLLSALPHLEELYIQNIRMTMEDWRQLDALPPVASTQLRILDIRNTYIDNDGLATLTKLFPDVEVRTGFSRENLF